MANQGKLFRFIQCRPKAMVLKSAFSACRESSLVCLTTVGMSLATTPEERHTRLDRFRVLEGSVFTRPSKAF